jgi:hypothetical protein
MAKHIMADIETLGIEDDCLVLSIGGVLFDQHTILDKFHVGIDPVDAQRYGLKIDAATAWNYWADPKRDAARKMLFELPKVDFYAAMEGFKMWVEETPLDERGSLWGKGATFDNVRIKNLFRVAGIPSPFSYRQDECYRTLMNRFPDVSYIQHGVAHDALDDAMSQALHMQAICNKHSIAL